MTNTCFKVFPLVTVLLLFCHAQWSNAQTGPSGCTYSDDVFTCDYSTMTSSERPIDYSGFSIAPQTLIVNINGFLPDSSDGRTFSTGFSGIDTSGFDANLPAALTIDCERGGSAFISAGAIYDMDYVQRFTVRNCDIFNFASDTVDGFGQLDYFAIHGGSITSIDVGAFGGLSVEKLNQTFPRQHGHFEIQYSKFTSGSLTVGLLYDFAELNSVAIRGGNVSAISADTFRYNTKLTMIDISDNTFTSLPSSVFDGLDLLSDVKVYNIDWECTCDNLAWLAYTYAENITLFGDFACANVEGIAIGDSCQNVLGIIILSITIISLGLVMTALALAILTARQAPAGPDQEAEPVAEIDKVEDLSKPAGNKNAVVAKGARGAVRAGKAQD
ncbi:uncharacterized protein LOC128246066 [Mya arenaria]|uniref:uncharacterized protein LOC128246066 n=1 Tax=Mya arenaria TaxID=6604 RepID=UPI0022E03D6D|nr:uncharacterized protein LOC128246066 [Mya arenaria]